jgi:Holliday junction resolvase RusA-like endonuclease
VTVSFVIPGKPFAKQRARSTRQGRVYTPKETVSFERTVGQIAMQHFTSPIEGPVRLCVTAHFCPPASWSAKKRAAHIGQPHTQRPDIDNCIKAISDGLNRIAWGDDGQVAEIVAMKRWAETEKTIVEVSIA